MQLIIEQVHLHDFFLLGCTLEVSKSCWHRTAGCLVSLLAQQQKYKNIQRLTAEV